MEVVAQLIVLLSAAAAATLNCSISKSHDGSFSLVMNHTLHSVDLKDCKDFLLYKRECNGVQVEASCSVNCSLFVVKSHPPSSKFNFLFSS
ncbi:hypothetical protein OJAV_G00034670 [Oryzias javanicus]|uniref:Uncharacterized protein n=1 Tax=Oryzias javanicus TaxID=123683 RepID=A0A3S2N573_ORYJA|nr:hypothetical protein OJAV_G00034670 [Oryzias javanicus]